MTSRSPGTAQQLEEYRQMVSSVRDYAIFMLDAGGHVRTWNRGAEYIKGYGEDEAVGRHFSAFYTDEDRARGHPEHLLAVAERDGSTEDEGWRVRRDGTRFWANVVITAVRDDDGELLGFAKVTRDLSERRAGEERLRALAAELERSNAALQEFASAAAHDLVEPLHTMSGLAELVQRFYGECLDDEGRSYLEEIHEGSVRMRGMVDALLDYARASHGEVQRQPVAVAPVVESVLRGLRARIEEGGLEVVWDPAQMPTVRADAGLLQSILGNLVANALKFSPEPGSVVTISAARDEDEPALWRISVQDQGIGIAPEQQERVFDLFQRLHPRETYPGTGLGLALCRRLVDRLGGRIGVASAPGEGSRFWFTLEGA